MKNLFICLITLIIIDLIILIMIGIIYWSFIFFGWIFLIILAFSIILIMIQKKLKNKPKLYR